jgi:hypothetical protein
VPPIGERSARSLGISESTPDVWERLITAAAKEVSTDPRFDRALDALARELLATFHTGMPGDRVVQVCNFALMRPPWIEEVDAQAVVNA